MLCNDSSFALQVPGSSVRGPSESPIEAEHVDLNYWREKDDVGWGHMRDGKPDLVTHALALHINVPEGAHYLPAVAKGGVGLVLARTGNGFQVFKMLKGSPAHRSYKIVKGDVLVHVDGKEFDSAGGQESGGIIAGLAGPVGSSVTLGFRRIDGEMKKVNLTRDEKSFPDEMAFNVEHYGQRLGVPASQLTQRVLSKSVFRDPSVPPYVPPPIIRAPTPPAYPTIVTRQYGESIPGFGTDRAVVSISPRQQSPRDLPRHDPALQPGFSGYRSSQVQVLQPIRVELRGRPGDRLPVSRSPVAMPSPRNTGQTE